MERLKKEIIKRRLNLLKEAETELEIEFPPAPKQRRKRGRLIFSYFYESPKILVPRVANENNAPKQNSDENLDAAIFTLKEEVIEVSLMECFIGECLIVPQKCLFAINRNT